MTKKITQTQVVHRNDYMPPDFRVERVALDIELKPVATCVRGCLDIKRNPESPRDNAPLVLHGEQLALKRLALDGNILPDEAYTVDEGEITIEKVPAAFTLETEVEINPSTNTALEGLFLTNGMFCTQCEAEGFRRITYFPDRPDILARYRTRLIADRQSCPVLLSNGNLVEQGQLDGARHYAVWDDPFPKPSYLFALVAGDLACVEDSYTTMSGRRVALRLFVEHGNEHACGYALDSLKRAMRWDEETYGLEYDLDAYMIVAVSHFNMGAMENKGLNIFNAKFVLASPETATDEDFAGIESVISHEYFHNWTGNRVTCRDWFQLSLKEGLTVFRDQEFSADQRSRPVSRINDVRRLRAHQFAEDAGPLAHPVRPDSYAEINNFYTATVYEKGAELVRMIQSLIGKAQFRDGLRRYLRDNDGTAATVEDFISAMEAASGRDLTQFMRWYEQSGTPAIEAEGTYDAINKSYTLTLEQRCDPTPGQPRKKPFHIPVTIALLDGDGRELPLQVSGANEKSPRRETVLDLTEPRQSFVFENVSVPPTPSLLRDFSAPVKIAAALAPEQRQFLAARDTDPFNRWQTGQAIAMEYMINAITAYGENGVVLPADGVVQTFGAILRDDNMDKDFKALALTLPSESDIAQHFDTIDVEAIHAVREALCSDLARHFRTELADIYHTNASNAPYTPDPAEAGRRSLRNCALRYLSKLNEPDCNDLVVSHFSNASNMTDAIAALTIISDLEIPHRQSVLDDFYLTWRNNSLVLDKWFTIQAKSCRSDTLSKVQRLLDHEAFDYKTPNRVRALIGGFCAGNQLRFNASDGSGYRFLADQVLTLDPINAQVAARLLTAFEQWRRLDDRRQSHVRSQLDRILKKEGLSRDVYDIAARTLN